MRSVQILLNLISNGIKFSNEDESIGVSCDYTTDEDNPTKFQVTFKVADKGIGIAEEDQSNIFKPFFRTNDTQSKQYNSSGHGLGLSIC